MKLKQEASRYPEEVRSKEQKQRYIEDYLEHEGIQLDSAQIVKNPGLRSFSKLALNSFYGKFGQRGNMKKTQMVKDLGTMYGLLTDNSKSISNWHIMTPDIMMMEFTTKDNFEVEPISGNVVIAAMCTSWARLKPWEAMNKLGDRVLYHDTDSIIFSSKEGDYMLPTGDYLGEFTNELACKELGCPGCQEGHWIKEFLSCGPKNYAYKLNSGQVTCKVREFSLNYQNSQILNFDSMKRTLLSWHQKQQAAVLQWSQGGGGGDDDDGEDVVTVSITIVRDKYNPKVYNRILKKRYGVVYDKRVVLPDLTTIPYGFRG